MLARGVFDNGAWRLEREDMPRGRPLGSKNRPKSQGKAPMTQKAKVAWVERILQQRDWRMAGLCALCGNKHSTNWHREQEHDEDVREAMLLAMDEYSQ